MIEILFEKDKRIFVIKFCAYSMSKNPIILIYQSVTVQICVVDVIANNDIAKNPKIAIFSCVNVCLLMAL